MLRVIVILMWFKSHIYCQDMNDQYWGAAFGTQIFFKDADKYLKTIFIWKLLR